MLRGGYYLWQPDELKKILSQEEWLAASKAWQMEAGPTTEDGYLPIAYRASAEVAAELGISEKLLAQRLISAKKTMIKARSQRSLPVDNKQLAAWNGLALSAFAQAAVVLDDDRYKNIANGIKSFILSRLWKKDTLLRARDARGQAIGKATLEDYAYVAQGLLAWARLSKESGDYDKVEEIVGQAWKRFFTSQGWRLTETSLLANAASEVMLADGPMPSPSAELLRATLGLLKERENTPLRAQAMHAIAVGQELLLEDPYWFASHARVVFVLQQP